MALYISHSNRQNQNMGVSRKNEYKKFLGAAGDELDRLMRENQDVLRRLKERD